VGADQAVISLYEQFLEREIDRLEQAVHSLQAKIEQLELENTNLQMELRRFSFARVRLEGE
jgi:regulator of replication initiation timing